MEFWGLEVKPGMTVKCAPGDGHILHLSQAALGESKKANDNALMYVKVDGQKLAVGTLSADKHPQIQFDLVFEKEFELSHTSKAASVFFSGYKVIQPAEEDEMDLDSEEEGDGEEEELNVPVQENGKAQAKEKEQKTEGKAGTAASKSNAVAGDVKKKGNDDDSDEDETDDSDEDDDLSPDEDSDDNDTSSDEDDSSEDDDEESDEDDEEETPKKPEAGKKRVAENALKTPTSDKKAKVATPSGQKTGGKKGTHVATPHPAKQASKTPANNDKSKTPKSAGSISCNSCSKTFNSEMALQAHAKAKKH